MATWLSTGALTARLAPEVLLELADDDESGAPDAGVIDAALTDAEGVVEAHLAGRYPVPLTSGDKVVTEIGITVAIHRLYLRRSADAPAHVKEAYASALARLDALAGGQANLPLRPPTAGLPEITRRPDGRIFTEETLDDF